MAPARSSLLCVTSHAWAHNRWGCCLDPGPFQPLPLSPFSEMLQLRWLFLEAPADKPSSSCTLDGNTTLSDWKGHGSIYSCCFWKVPTWSGEARRVLSEIPTVGGANTVHLGPLALDAGCRIPLGHMVPWGWGR